MFLRRHVGESALHTLHVHNIICLVKGEQYWKTIFKGMIKGVKTKTSYIILFCIGGSSKEK